jgi:hypothetical protein
MMTRHHTCTAMAGLVALALISGCDRSNPTALSTESAALFPEGGTEATQASGKKLDPSVVCDPGQGGFTPTSTNPYFPIQVGSQWQYEGVEDDELIELRITILDVTEVVAGVTTQVLEERETADGELTEISRNFFAQAGDGTVCYFGEDVDIYEDGEIVSHDGAWRADEPGNGPGIFMPAAPTPGMKYLIEVAPGVAEDQATIVGQGPVTVPAGTFTTTIRLREFNPLDGDKGYKVHAAGVGLVVDDILKLVSFSL